MRYLVLLLVAASAIVVTGQSPRTFTGVITDSECSNANHSTMRMGDTDEECVQACIDAHGASYVLFDGSATYQLSDQKAPAAFAAKRVTVTGTLDEKTKRIQVQSIVAAK